MINWPENFYVPICADCDCPDLCNGEACLRKMQLNEEHDSEISEIALKPEPVDVQQKVGPQHIDFIKRLIS